MLLEVTVQRAVLVQLQVLPVTQLRQHLLLQQDRAVRVVAAVVVVATKLLLEQPEVLARMAQREVTVN
jgi:hypothetical protein